MALPPPSRGEPSERTYHRPRAGRKALLAAIAVTAGAAWACVRWRPFRVEIGGPSMRPSLEPGDWVLAVTSARVRRGDVVVVEHPGRPGFEMVKRVIALPGDPSPGSGAMGEDEYWVEGDAPDHSTDSRHFGPVRREHVKAAVRLVYWPAERRRLIRPSRSAGSIGG